MELEMSRRRDNIEDVTIYEKIEKLPAANANHKTPIIDAMKNSTENKVIEITNKREYEKFKEKYNRSVVFYGAEWCHACKDIGRLYSRIANRYHKRVAMAHVDIDVANLDFTHVPVFAALRHGKQIDSMEGADRAGLKELVKKAIMAE